MSLRVNDEVTLAIEKPVAGGRMLARHEGQVVLVVGAIPGERVRTRVERVTRQLAFAETVEVLDASSDRRAIATDLACGGTLYAHIAYRRQLLFKSELIADGLARIGKLSLPAAVQVMESPENGYRMRARLHIRNGRLGFFREGTHTLCDAAATGQLLPATVAALKEVERGFATSGRDKAVSCEVSENILADQRAVLLEREDGTAHLAAGCDSPYVTDRIEISSSQMTLTRHVRSFFQGNRWLLPQLVKGVLAQVPDGAVIDLYAGVGLFAVSLAASGRSNIVAVEGDRFSADDLAANAGAYPAAIAVKQAPVERYLDGRDLAAPDTIILDPPRTGLSGEALSGILALSAPRVVYVSCDVATLARDLRRFGDSGYHLEHIEAFDLFPNTPHVETLAVLVH